MTDDWPCGKGQVVATLSGSYGIPAGRCRLTAAVCRQRL